jgi:hypothetical protein
VLLSWSSARRAWYQITNLFHSDLGDTDFVQGQFSEATAIFDTPSLWNPVFAGTNIHGVFLLASDELDNINTELANIQSILGSSITEMFVMDFALFLRSRNNQSIAINYKVELALERKKVTNTLASW